MTDLTLGRSGSRVYDVVVVGAGSVGIPIAMSLAELRMKVLVLDGRPSPGQGENKAAIGGIRATHSDPAKITACLRTLEIVSTWKETHGDDLEWLQGGYVFPTYREQDRDALLGLLPVQRDHGLRVDFVSADVVREIVPGINPQGLLGGHYSPHDGSASPLLCANAFHRRACSLGAEFRFREPVEKIVIQGGRAHGVRTAAGETIPAGVVIDAAGANAGELCTRSGLDLPVVAEAHEAGITEPFARLFTAMVVDIRPAEYSKNFYFYQSARGQLVFCITPEPPILAADRRETSTFLPQVAARIVDLMPRLKNLRVRRTWRGLYPMTPDASPVVGWDCGVEGLFHVAGMCGQGFMLGPGLGESVARTVTGATTEKDDIVLGGFDLGRDFCKTELLK